MPVYAGLFLIALSALAIQIILVRLLSVITWYHLAFFSISTAMLGMTVGAIQVYLQKDRFNDANKIPAIVQACLRFSLSIPATLILLCLLPVGYYKSVMSLIALVMTTLVCAWPFYYTGLVITTVLTRFDMPIGRLYASDLAGASIGCLIVLGGLELVDAPSLMLWCSSIGALSGACFARLTQASTARRYTLLALLFFILGIANAQTPHGIRPMFVKEKLQNLNNHILEQWNSFSRVIVYRQQNVPPQLWGPSEKAPQEPHLFHSMDIDGEASTGIRYFASPQDIEHLRYDVTNLGYYLNRKGNACIIGVGGGKDMQSALLFGHDTVLGIEVNPIFIDLLQNRFDQFAGLANRDNVAFVVDDARSYLSQSQEQYDIIQMALIDTWAATGAGAFSLSENALYTVEAWQTFLNRLSPNGIFTVSRWYSPTHIGETGRVLSLAVEALLRLNIKNPSDHIALITTNNVSTLLICRQPLSPSDLQRLTQVCTDLKYQIVHLPNQLPSEPILKQIVSASSTTQLNEVVKDTPLNYLPPTDDNPYFFNMLKLSHLSSALYVNEGVAKGNLKALITLILLIAVLTLIAIATIAVPLYLAQRPQTHTSGFWYGALYFSLIGSAFMFAEIALIQRLNVFLGHPIYSLGILLFTLIASTGLGSFISDHLPLTRKPYVYLYPIITAISILLLNTILHHLLTHMISENTLTKIFMSILVIFPTGMLMGLFFPVGMRLVQTTFENETPWFWALNGIMSVLCSALAVFISIVLGISTNFYFAAITYTLILLSIYHLRKQTT